MHWSQVTDPFNNLALSLVVALLPILFIFWALIIKKMAGYKAILSATLIAVLTAIFIYGMPVKISILSVASGALYGIFPISWMIIAALFLFNITIKSGQFEIIKHFMASVTSDRRLQALLIAFSFGAFLEGTAGFGAPVAITAAMLVGLGFDPLYAAGICLIANTSPVAFGSIGIPIAVASQVTSIPEMAISQMVGRTLPIVSLILPCYLVIFMCGIKKTREVFPAVLVSGLSFALIQWASANFLGPSLPDILAGIGSIVCLMVFIKFWKPKNTWRFANELPQLINEPTKHSTAQLVRAWSPFIILTIMIIAWGLQPIKEFLNSFGQVVFQFPVIHNAIIGVDGKLIPHVFKFNYLSAAGTAIFLSAIIAIPLIGLSFKSAAGIFLATLKQLLYPTITIASILGFANLVNDSGIILTVAQALAKTGYLFPFFAPVLGWLGVFITGSDTSSNALFGKLQSVTATSIGIDPVLTVAANTSGGVIGKMISPSSIAVAAAAGNLVGSESKLFRFTLKHSFILLTFTCIIILAQTYLFSWIIPTYHLRILDNASITHDFSKGYIYLIALGFIIGVMATIIISGNRKKIKEVRSNIKE
jgi:lactate permease